jgi:hypothetical protein
MASEESPEGTEVQEPPKVSINPITRKPWTDEDRRIASERAKAQVARGELGGQSHGRARKKPAYATAAAIAAANGKKLADELLDIALNGSSEKLRLDAIKILFEQEQKLSQEGRDEMEHLLKMTRDELETMLAQRIFELTGTDVSEYIDGSAEESGVYDEAAPQLTR